MPFGEGPEAGHRRDVRDGRVDARGHRDYRAAVRHRDLASQVSRISKLLDDELEQFRNRPLGSYPVVYLDAHYGRQGSVQDVAVLKAESTAGASGR